jgi:hypothetical protein
MSHSEIEQLKKYIDEKLDPLIEQHNQMYEAYVTVKNGSTWVKYAFWFIGALVAAFLALRDFFKN